MYRNKRSNRSRRRRNAEDVVDIHGVPHRRDPDTGAYLPMVKQQDGIVSSHQNITGQRSRTSRASYGESFDEAYEAIDAWSDYYSDDPLGFIGAWWMKQKVRRGSLKPAIRAITAQGFTSTVTASQSVNSAIDGQFDGLRQAQDAHNAAVVNDIHGASNRRNVALDAEVTLDIRGKTMDQDYWHGKRILDDRHQQTIELMMLDTANIIKMTIVDNFNGNPAIAMQRIQTALDEALPGMNDWVEGFANKKDRAIAAEMLSKHLVDKIQDVANTKLRSGVEEYMKSKLRVTSSDVPALEGGN